MGDYKNVKEQLLKLSENELEVYLQITIELECIIDVWLLWKSTLINEILIK